MSPGVFPDIFARDGEPGVSVLTMTFSYTLPAREPREPWLSRLARILRDVWHKGRW